MGGVPLPRMPTPPQWQTVMILEVLKRWVCRRSRCCDFHSAARELRNLALVMECTPCGSGCAPVQQRQCPQCFVLMEDSGNDAFPFIECDVCGHALAHQPARELSLK